jgi:hypothetical protein
MFFSSRNNVKMFDSIKDAVVNGSNSGLIEMSSGGKEKRFSWRDYGDVIEIAQGRDGAWQVASIKDIEHKFRRGVFGRVNDWSVPIIPGYGEKEWLADGEQI